MNGSSEKAFFAWISRQSFIVYLSHVLIMRIGFSAAYVIGFQNIWDSFEGMVFLFIVTVAGTLIFAYLISFIPLVVYPGGVSRRKKEYVKAIEKERHISL